MGAFNLGGFANQLSLDERNQAAQSVGATSAPTWGDVSQAAASSPMGGTQPPPQQQAPSGWDQTQKYMGAVSTAADENQNGLSKVLGLVGAFV